MSKTLKHQLLHPKDPGSAITHFIGMLLIGFAMIPLLVHTLNHCSRQLVSGFSMIVFCLSMFLLYTASTSYHTFNLTKRINLYLKKCDHMEKNVCLYYHIGECLGYCVKDIDKDKIIDMEKDMYIPERDWKPSFYDPDSGGNPINIYCKCGLEFCTGTYDYQEFINAWNRRC